MSKFRIGDTLYAITSETILTHAMCKECGGQSVAVFKNGKEAECGSCTDGKKEVYYRKYDIQKEPVKIQGFREFTGIETEYYSEGVFRDGSEYLITLWSFYSQYDDKDAKPISKKYPENRLFQSLREAEQAAFALNRNAENEALEKYWKDDDTNEDY